MKSNPMILIGIILGGIASYFLYSAGIEHRNVNTQKILNSNKITVDKNDVIFNTNRFLIDLRDFKNEWSSQFEKQRALMTEIDNKYLNNPEKHAYESEKNWRAESTLNRQFLEKYNQKFRFEGKRMKKEMESLLRKYKTSEITYGVYDRVFTDLDLANIIDDLDNLVVKLRTE